MLFGQATVLRLSAGNNDRLLGHNVFRTHLLTASSWYVVAMHTHINTYTVINTLHTDVRYRWMAVLQRSKCAWRSVDS